MYLYGIVFWILGAVAPNVPAPVAEANVIKFYETVALIESDMNRFAVNEKTSSASYFQMTRGAFKTAKRRARRMGVNYQEIYVGQLDYANQVNLIFLDFYQRKGTNWYIRKIAEGDESAAIEAYFKYHHTKPDRATIRRARRIFGEQYEVY